MENKLGRKSMQDWQAMTDKLTDRVYKSGFKAGYDVAKDETPDVEDMAKLLVDRYTGSELSDLMMAIDRIYPHVPHKTVNQQRAELIQRAREFVKRYLKLKAPDGNYDVPYLEIENSYGSFINVYPRFRIDEKKRTVVLLLKGAQTNRVRFKGITKCHPDEVFNADIGKAIALARALEIEIPQEFMEAVQPDDWAVGQEVKSMRLNEVRTVTRLGLNTVDDNKGGYWNKPRLNEGKAVIIDDTNAQY